MLRCCVFPLLVFLPLVVVSESYEADPCKPSGAALPDATVGSGVSMTRPKIRAGDPDAPQVVVPSSLGIDSGGGFDVPLEDGAFSGMDSHIHSFSTRYFGPHPRLYATFGIPFEIGGLS